MRNQFSTAVALVACLMTLSAVPAWAHHAFSAEFDANKPIKLQGVVKKVEWINPHSWITVEIKTPDGTTQTWEIEAGAPNAMFRRGFNRNSIPVGTEIVINGYQAKDGRHRANGLDLTLPNGQRLFLASSAPDAHDKEDKDNK